MTQAVEHEQKKMTFWEHLEELRRRLVRAIIAYVIGVLISWTYRDEILAWLWKPFAESWTSQGIPGEPSLNFAAPSDAFMAYMKLSLMGGLLIAAPVIFYQLWSFVAPGLYAKEKKYVFPFVFFSTLLFVGGGLFGYRIAFPITFDYFLGLAGTAKDVGLSIQPVVMMGEYLDFVRQLLLAFGLVFELPLLILFLSIAGVVNWLQLLRFGRWFVLVAFIVGALISPPDTTSQLVMALPLCVLYFASIGLAYLFGKRPSEEEIEAERGRRQERREEARIAREEKRRERAEKARKKKAG